jgi:hypothetical protein
MILKSLSYTSRSFHSTIYSSCKSKIYLSQYYKGFWGYIRKKKRAKSEKRKGEERTSVILGEKGLPP